MGRVKKERNRFKETQEQSTNVVWSSKASLCLYALVVPVKNTQPRNLAVVLINYYCLRHKLRQIIVYHKTIGIILATCFDSHQLQNKCNRVTCSCGQGDIMSLNCGHQRAYFLIPQIMSIKSHGGMIVTRENQRTRRTYPSATQSTTSQNRLTRASAMRGRRLTA
jgi:hypothetical protein